MNCPSDETPTDFISCDKFSREKTKIWSLYTHTHKKEVGLYLDIFGLFSVKNGMMVGTTKVYSLIPVWMTLTFRQGHSYMRKQKVLHTFSYNFFPNGFGWNLVRYHDLLVCLAHANILCIIDIQFRQLYLGDLSRDNLCFTLACILMVMNRFLSNLAWC